ncbi:CAuncharacterized [Mya arenaria]|uniref:CAuncharacterized n=1 Tax=Mya arenaria TaxID=6604 RepID=A0ABY7E125_MYAAR|nr:CAuncharacterized [Mya arenaria]
MGSGSSKERSSSRGEDFVVPQNLVNGTNISTMDSSHTRKMTDEESSSKKSRKTANSNGHIKNGPVSNGSPHFLSTAQVQALVDKLEDGQLFCDPDFPADNTSLFFSPDKQNADRTIVWKRPQDIVEEWQTPQLMIDGMTRDDIKQGILGDCWFLSSCAAVSQKENFLKKVMCKNQPLCGEGYQGIVHFKFWRFGKWVDVYIDDRLPTRNKKLIYASCTDSNEFWVSLIEKAYAKLNGSYEAIDGGQTMDALVDMTGGLAERFEIEKRDLNLYRQILRASKSEAFITCSRKIQHKMGEEKLVRIRNPWADGTEWKGSWSDNDSNWQWVDDETKQRLQLQKKDDGEFWMSFRDFCKHFSDLTICLMGPDFDGDGISDKAGHVEIVHGEWREGVSAGGSRNDLWKFATNPQYLLTLTEPDAFDEETDDPELEGMCSVEEPVTYSVSARYFRYNPDSGKSGVYVNFREVSGRFELEPGHYVLIPSSFRPDDESAFMLRIFGESTFKLEGPLPSDPEPEH